VEGKKKGGGGGRECEFRDLLFGRKEREVPKERKYSPPIKEKGKKEGVAEAWGAAAFANKFTLGTRRSDGKKKRKGRIFNPKGDSTADGLIIYPF